MADEPMTEIRTGEDAIRAKLLAFMRKGHLGVIIRDLPETGIAALESFCTSNAKLPLPTLQRLARLLLDAELDPATGLLRPAFRPEPQSLGSGPPPFDPTPRPDPDHRSGVGGGVDADGRPATNRGGRDGNPVAGQRDCQGRSDGQRVVGDE